MSALFEAVTGLSIEIKFQKGMRKPLWQMFLIGLDLY